MGEYFEHHGAEKQSVKQPRAEVAVPNGANTGTMLGRLRGQILQKVQEVLPPPPRINRNMTYGPDSPSLKMARNTFDRIFSSKPGKIFFILPDGSIQKEVGIPKKLLILQGSKDEKDRAKYKIEYKAFVEEERKHVNLDADLMTSGNKFQQIIGNSEVRFSPEETRRQHVVHLFEQGLKFRTETEAKNDTDTLWDMLDADGRKLMIDMFAGMCGMESGFNPDAGLESKPGAAKGLTQLMPKRAEELGMQSGDVFNIEKVVPKTAEFFKNLYVALKRGNLGGPLDVIQRYGLPDTRFLVYAMYDAYHAGDGNIRALCFHLLNEYPTAESLPDHVRKNFNSAEIYTFMTHRGDQGMGSYGPDSRNYVPQVVAITEMFKRMDVAPGKKTR